MCKKVYLIILIFSLSILLIIPSYAVTVPENASPVSILWSPRFLYQSRDGSGWVSREVAPLTDEFYPDNGSNNDQIAVWPSIIFSDSPNGTYYTLQDTYTYYMEYEVYIPNGDLYSFSTNVNSSRLITQDNVLTVFGDFSSSQVSSPGLTDENSVPITDYVSDTAISTSFVDSKTMKVTFAFTTGMGISAFNFAAISMPGTAAFSTQNNLRITTFQAYADPIGGVFGQLQLQIAAQQQASLDQMNNKLDNIGNQLTGDPDDYQDNSGFDSAAGELEDLEGQINDQITGNVTIDGESYEMDGALIGNYKEGFMDRWDPQDYEASAGREIARLFDLFYPYVGVAIFLNLTLAVILAFLRGRSNA